MSIETIQRENLKETNGIRLGGPMANGPNDGAFVCMECFYANHSEHEKNRQHNPLIPVVCMDCNEYCISPLGNF